MKYIELIDFGFNAELMQLNESIALEDHVVVLKEALEKIEDVKMLKTYQRLIASEDRLTDVVGIVEEINKEAANEGFVLVLL